MDCKLTPTGRLQWEFFCGLFSHHFHVLWQLQQQDGLVWFLKIQPVPIPASRRIKPLGMSFIPRRLKADPGFCRFQHQRGQSK